MTDDTRKFERVSDPPSLKVHRRDVTLDGRVFTALSLRPGTTERFATNWYHSTWHVLGDRATAQLLARLCWAMAFQHRERTLFVIDQRFLVPNPFDADRSTPLVVVNADLGTPSRAGVDQLRGHLPWSRPSEGTVRLNTHTFGRMTEDRDALLNEEIRSGQRWNDHRQRSWINEVNGLLVLAAPSNQLKWWAYYLRDLGEQWYQGADSTYLGDDAHHDGEVQVLEDLEGTLRRAVETRSRLFPGRADERLTEDERELVWFDPDRQAAHERA